MTIVVQAPDTYATERRYVLDVVLSEWLGLDYAVAFGKVRYVAIRLAADPSTTELSMPDVLFATPLDGWLTESAMPDRPLARLQMAGRAPGQTDFSDSATSPAQAPTLPVIFGTPAADGLAWRRTAMGASLSIDVFGSVFFLLSRYEEVVLKDRDIHERFPSSASLAVAEGFLDRPIVDEYVDLLWTAMQSLWPALTRRPSTFRFRPTHDVDLTWAGLAHRALIGDLLRRHDPVLAGNRLRAFVDVWQGRVDNDPFNTFDFLMETSERWALRSTFYFRVRGTRGDARCRYRLLDQPVADLLRRIHVRGHDIGLHASYESYRSADRIAEELLELQTACRRIGFEQAQWGVRQHFLRLDVPLTWRCHEAAGLDHDSTLGYADRVGFRAGTSREYPLFDLVARQRLRLRERRDPLDS